HWAGRTVFGHFLQCICSNGTYFPILCIAKHHHHVSFSQIWYQLHPFLYWCKNDIRYIPFSCQLFLVQFLVLTACYCSNVIYLHNLIETNTRKKIIRINNLSLWFVYLFDG